MKKLVMIIFVFAAIVAKAQDRNIIWAHGLGGDVNAWKHYDEVFDSERKVHGVRIDYATQKGVSYASSDAYGDINDRLTYSQEHDSRNIIIGHSMGGVVSRNLAASKTGSNKRFGGIITVNSPNYGAPLINSMDDGSVETAAEDAAEKLTAGPIAGGIPTTFKIVADISSERIWKMLLTDELFDDIVKDQTRVDLKPSCYLFGGYLNYSTAANNTPTINIWSEETSPVHWRLIDSYTGYANDNSDADLPRDINIVRSFYNTKYLQNITNANANVLNPIAFAYYKTKAKKWKKGRDWIDDSENIWSSLIETSRVERQTYWVNVWIPCDYPPRKNPDPNCGHWESQQRTRYVSVNYPSDGLLPQYTQVLNNVSGGNVYHISGANHTEVRDMSHSGTDWTKKRFNQIFDGENWFKTSRR